MVRSEVLRQSLILYHILCSDNEASRALIHIIMLFATFRYTEWRDFSSNKWKGTKRTIQYTLLKLKDGPGPMTSRPDRKHTCFFIAQESDPGE
jgi:hypothetical protein